MPQTVELQGHKTSEGSANRQLIRSFDAMEFYVGNAHQSAYYLRRQFGLVPRMRAGLDTGTSEATSYLLSEGGVQFIVSSPIRQGAIATYVHQHGEGIRDVSFSVNDVDSVFTYAIENGAKGIEKPHWVNEGEHKIRKATLAGPGDTVHSLVRGNKEAGFSLPGGRAIETTDTDRELGLNCINHVAIAVEQGELDQWADYYKAAFRFDIAHEEITATKMTAMRSKVVENELGTVKIVLLEPASAKKQSQIQDFLEYHYGPGVQHVAILCESIARTVAGLRANGVEFISIPETYYELLPTRFDVPIDDIATLRELRLLVDKDEWGDLIQTFTKPLTSRPTLFFEFIQRNGARGFGSGNIRALFEALECAQGRSL